MQIKTIFTDPYFDFTHTTYDYGYAGSCGVTGPLVYSYYWQMLQRLSNGNLSAYLQPNGPFRGLKVETWNSVLAEQTDDNIDWNIEHSAGLTAHEGTKVNHQYASKGTYSHEQGHYYGWHCGFGYNPNTKAFSPSQGVSEALVKEYRTLRAVDFTSRTPEAERWAEDFKQFFGADGIANEINYDDDAARNPVDGKNIRWPSNVNGLKELIQYSWPIYNWLKDKQFSNFTYIVDWRQIQWWCSTTNRWECYCFGNFYKWVFVNNNWQWVLM